MTKEEIIEVARQAGFDEHHAKFDTRIKAFAKLVAEKEREACADIAPQRKPLTDEQIDAIADEYLVDYRIPAGCAWNFARDIEAAHGIKE